jgi:CubicO group peptidase (beta-lactamase class C family)
VFRIASMTKSFTASVVLALRDDHALALDDLVEQFVPELRRLRRASADSPPVTVRHLLTMTAGFPTDDPWGDRLQGMPLPDFAQLLAARVRQAWAPGTRFEYSNLGFALLGRVITAVTKTEYADVVRQRLLGPLGLSLTGFEAGDFDTGRLARGYRRTDSTWTEVQPDGYGAFAPMGGVFSCVADLARWVGGFIDAFPPRQADTDDPHPLSRATRREMQMQHAAMPAQPPTLGPGRPAATAQRGYGFGLFVEEDPMRGRIVQHSGGYPGFGSQMRWHPATGTGVIVLANSTYATSGQLATMMLDALLTAPHDRDDRDGRDDGHHDHDDQDGHRTVGLVRGPAPAPGTPWPETLDAQRKVTRLIGSWDDAQADALFAPNVAQDEPYPERREKISVLGQRIGDLRDDPERPAQFDSPAHCRWWLRGERGVVAAEIRMTPEPQPRVQLWTLAIPPADGSALQRVIDALISVLNEGAEQWPDAVEASDTLDTSVLLRQLRVAAAWAGRCRPAAYRSGNGDTKAAIELDGETARLTLTVEIDGHGHRLQQMDLSLRP